MVRAWCEISCDLNQDHSNVSLMRIQMPVIYFFPYISPWPKDETLPSFLWLLLLGGSAAMCDRSAQLERQSTRLAWQSWYTACSWAECMYRWHKEKTIAVMCLTSCSMNLLFMAVITGWSIIWMWKERPVIIQKSWWCVTSGRLLQVLLLLLDGNNTSVLHYTEVQITAEMMVE